MGHPNIFSPLPLLCPVTEVHVEAFVAGHIAGLPGPNGTLAFAEVQFAELVVIHLGLVERLGTLGDDQKRGAFTNVTKYLKDVDVRTI